MTSRIILKFPSFDMSELVGTTELSLRIQSLVADIVQMTGNPSYTILIETTDEEYVDGREE